MPMYWGSLTNQAAITGNSDSIDRACKELCGIPEGLFKFFDVPVGMDRELAIHIIMREHGRAALYRPDPFWMVDAVKYWTQESMPIWEKLYSTTRLKYNPIWNTDVSERTTDIRTTDRDTSNDRTAQTRNAQRTDSDRVTANDSHEQTSGTSHMADDGNTTGESHDVTHGTSAGTSHTDTTGTMDGKTHEDTTGNTVTNTTTDTNTVGKEVVDGTDKTTTDQTKNLDQTVTRDISPENAPDYQPDDQTHTVAAETLHSTVDFKHNQTTDTTGESHTTGLSTTNTTGTADGTSHQDTKGTEDNKTTGETWGTADGTTAGTSHEQQDTETHGTADVNAKGTDKQHTDAKALQHEDEKNIGKEKVTDTYNHGWIRQGNIGVTTTQQMIDAERETVLYDVYLTIANDYHKKFCLDLY